MSFDDWKDLTLLELEQQMSPSRWNPNKTADQVIQEFLANTMEGVKIFTCR